MGINGKRRDHGAGLGSRVAADDAAVPEKKQPLPSFAWLWSFKAVKDCSPETGLPSPTRAVLFVIWSFMDNETTRAHPGLERIALESGLTRAAVTKHIELAIRRGWLKREQKHQTRYGLGYEYVAAYPTDRDTSQPGYVATGIRRNRETSQPAYVTRRNPDTSHAVTRLQGIPKLLESNSKLISKRGVSALSADAERSAPLAAPDSEPERLPQKFSFDPDAAHVERRHDDD